ncbi:MAG TPA: FAD-dependent oxidoreductase, partial [Actinoplanes sp.]|nr:FAD-dependent oxidoreductase [Actinoplanes sp.]
AIAKKFHLYDDTLFHTRVTDLTWDDDADEWIVSTDRGDRFRARHVVTSSGTLTQPKLPGIPGVEEFRGHTFHTSRWDYGYTGDDLPKLAGKRVAVVGTGATGIQVIPHVAEAAERGVTTVEPTAEAEQAWCDTIREYAPDNHRFQSECTPGYYNNEGRPREVNNAFGPGPIVFHDLLRRWREEGGFDQVLS